MNQLEENIVKAALTASQLKSDLHEVTKCIREMGRPEGMNRGDRAIIRVINDLLAKAREVENGLAELS